MALSFGFYNSIGGDRKYNAEEMGYIIDCIITDGIFANQGELFATVPGNGLQVIVKPGMAWFNTTWTVMDTMLPLSISPPDVSLKRYDAVVLEVNKTEAVRANSIKIITGSPASAPAKPELTNADGVYQYPLAYVLVEPGVTTIAASKIENVVGQGECPFATSVLEAVPIDDLFNQWGGEFTEWFENLKAQLSDNVVTNLQAQIDLKLDKSAKATSGMISVGGTNDEYYITPKRLAESSLIKTTFLSDGKNGQFFANERYLIRPGFPNLGLETYTAHKNNIYTGNPHWVLLGTSLVGFGSESQLITFNLSNPGASETISTLDRMIDLDSLSDKDMLPYDANTLMIDHNVLILGKLHVVNASNYTISGFLYGDYAKIAFYTHSGGPGIYFKRFMRGTSDTSSGDFTTTSDESIVYTYSKYKSLITVSNSNNLKFKIYQINITNITSDLISSSTAKTVSLPSGCTSAKIMYAKGFSTTGIIPAKWMRRTVNVEANGVTIPYICETSSGKKVYFLWFMNSGGYKWIKTDIDAENADIVPLGMSGTYHPFFFDRNSNSLIHLNTSSGTVTIVAHDSGSIPFPNHIDPIVYEGFTWLNKGVHDCLYYENGSFTQIMADLTTIVESQATLHMTHPASKSFSDGLTRLTDSNFGFMSAVAKACPSALPQRDLSSIVFTYTDINKAAGAYGTTKAFGHNGYIPLTYGLTKDIKWWR